MDDDSKPGTARATRRRSGRPKAQMSARLLPAQHGSSEASFSSTQLAAAPLPRGRRHPSVEYAALNQLLAELHRTGGYIDQLVLHMDKGTIAEVAEVRAAQRDTREAIALVLRRMDGEPE